MEIAEKVNRASEALKTPTKERPAFDLRLAKACRKDREMRELVFGTEPATTSHRVRLLYRCAYWRFTTAETVTLLAALDARPGDAD
jgi:hypothetical protein